MSAVWKSLFVHHPNSSSPTLPYPLRLRQVSSIIYSRPPHLLPVEEEYPPFPPEVPPAVSCGGRHQVLARGRPGAEATIEAKG
eukprot:757888-Hanusia_phi.AAC.1